MDRSVTFWGVGRLRGCAETGGYTTDQRVPCDPGKTPGLLGSINLSKSRTVKITAIPREVELYINKDNILGNSEFD